MLGLVLKIHTGCFSLQLIVVGDPDFAVDVAAEPTDTNNWIQDLLNSTR